MKRRVDANQTAIVEALRAVGAVWIPMSGDPKIGFDGIAIYHGQIFICELKDGDKPASARRLTDNEEKRRREVELAGATYYILLGPEQALLMIGK